MAARLLFLLLMLLAWAPAGAKEAYPYIFKNHQMSDGLCDNHVYSSYEDKSGFVWLCTANGLDRFDGHEFVHYTTAAKSRGFQLRSNFVKRVIEDDFEHLWGISDAGLFRIDLVTGEVAPIEVAGKAPAGLLTSSATALFKDSRGALWVGMRGQALRLTTDRQGRIAAIERFPLRGAHITSFAQQGTTVWAGTSAGISLFAITASGRAAAVAPARQPAALRGVGSVQALLVDGRRVWIGTSRGLCLYSPEGDALTRFSHDSANPATITSNQITSLALTAGRRLIVATRDGISIRQGQGFSQMLYRRHEPSPSSNDILDLMVDSHGRIWAGTAIAGFDIITSKSVVATAYFKNEGDNPNLVSCIFQDRDGNLLAGINNKGLAVQRAGSDTYTIHPLGIGREGAAGANNNDWILAITQDYEGNYWIATSQGLCFLRQSDLWHPRFTTFTTANSTIGNNFIADLLVDRRRGGVWVCRTDGLCFVSLADHRITQVALADGAVRFELLMTLALDADDNLWVGGNGLFVLPLRHDSRVRRQYPCRRYPYLRSGDKRQAMASISSIVQARSGKIYIGSLNGGIYEAEGSYARGYAFNACGGMQQVVNPKVAKIVEGKYGGIWVSTVEGAYYFNMSTSGFGTFDASMGLPETRFYIKSGCRLQNGQVCFGTPDGAYSLNVVSALEKGNRNVVISAVTADNQQLSMGSYINHYDIYPGTSTFEIAFSALEYVGQDNIVYAYKIDEVDKEWNVGMQHRARYTSLEPGEYTFRVKCTNKDNRWSTHETTLYIYIHPRFYQRAWFKGAVIVAVALLLLLLAAAYARHQKAIRRQLEHMVSERTHHLNRQKKELESKTRELSNAMDVLVKNDATMKYQNEQLLAKNEEIKKNQDLLEVAMRQREKANKEKMAIFTNLTHEFKTPLTLILGPMQKIAEHNHNPMLNHSIQIALRNSQYLLSLVEQIMDMHRAETNQLTYSERLFDLAALAEQDLADFGSLMAERRLTLSTCLHLPTATVVSDRQLIHTILLNLVSNAVKYTPNGGRIAVYMALPASATQLLISVTNSDSYISPDEQQKIFDRFYRIEDQHSYPAYGQSSTGIGLALVKQIVDMMGGRIAVKSSHRRGTTFRVCLPVKQGTPQPAAQLPAAPAESHRQPQQPQQHDRPVILLVEDNQDMRAYIREFLDRDYDVIEAIDGENGLEKALRYIPDFIISDLMMPRVDGYRLCQNIRSNATLCHIPFLMLTALSDDEARMQGYNHGIDSFLTKPFKPEVLLARIENIRTNLRRRQHQLSDDLSQAHTSTLIEDSDKAFLERLKRIMDANYKNPDFGGQQLLQEIGMSNTAFYRKIVALTGLSTSLYIRIYRLQVAKELIEKMDAKAQFNISDLAYEVGFNDPKYFTRCFVKQFGLTPTSLIKRVRG